MGSLVILKKSKYLQLLGAINHLFYALGVPKNSFTLFNAIPGFP